MTKSETLLKRLDALTRDNGPIVYTKKLGKEDKQMILNLCKKLDPSLRLKSVFAVDNVGVVAKHVKEFVVEDCAQRYAYFTYTPDDAYFHDVKGMVWHSRGDIAKVIERLNEF